MTSPAGEQQYDADGSAGEQVKGRGGGGEGGKVKLKGRSKRRDIYFTQDGQGAGGRGSQWWSTQRMWRCSQICHQWSCLDTLDSKF